MLPLHCLHLETMLSTVPERNAVDAQWMPLERMSSHFTASALNPGICQLLLCLGTVRRPSGTKIATAYRKVCSILHQHQLLNCWPFTWIFFLLVFFSSLYFLQAKSYRRSKWSEVFVPWIYYGLIKIFPFKWEAYLYFHCGVSSCGNYC